MDFMFHLCCQLLQWWIFETIKSKQNLGFFSLPVGSGKGHHHSYITNQNKTA